jgi:hypothetical protein
MRTRYFPSNCYRLVPVQSAEKREKPEWMRIITELANMNKGFIEKGAGRKVVNRSTGEQEYRDVPQFSLKLHKRDGKIHTYVNIPKDREQVVKTKFEQALYSDIGEYRIEEDPMELPETNLHAFSIKGSHHLAIDLDGNPKIKELFRSVDNMMYSLTVKEVEDHEAQRDQFEKARLGLTSKKAWAWHYTKTGAVAAAKMLYDFWYDGEEETKKKHQVAWKQIKKLLPKKEQQQPYTERKLSSEKNRFMLVEALFLLWTDDEEKAKQFHSNLQKLMTEMQGENRLEVVKVKPDLSKVAKGRIHYTLPTLCLYQAELSKFLLLPDVEDEFFYSEPLQKSKPPEAMYTNRIGDIAFARDMVTNEIVSIPFSPSGPAHIRKQALDDYSTPVISPGQMGAGKTVQIVNQVIETFCVKAKDQKEWRKKARSAVVFDVADGKMISSILNLIPNWLMDRVKILNHFDTNRPIPVSWHDVLRLSRQQGHEGAEFIIAQTETELLLDSLEDRSSTIAIDRYYKNALQASYTVGKGTMLDALRIITDEKYRAEVIQQLEEKHPVLRFNLIKDDRRLKDEKSLVHETIDNHLLQIMNNTPWFDCISQPVHEEIDFWRWMNGDEDGAYLVLVYIPKKLGKHLRKFLFAHYFLKTWRMMELREIIPEEKRRECLVIVDELHQIIDQEAVKKMFGDIFKEPRKYRVRYFFTFHGWSSLEKAGKKKTEIIQSMKDSGCNLIMLKGGKDTFEDIKEMLDPYDVKDFLSLSSMQYCAIFKIAYGKKSHVFMARMLEPPDQRLPTYRTVDLTKYQNTVFGRPKEEVRKSIKSDLELMLAITQSKDRKEKKKEPVELTF